MPFSVNPIRFHFRFRAKRSIRVAIRIYRISSGRARVVRRIVTGRLAPGRWHHRAWDGRDRSAVASPRPAGTGCSPGRSEDRFAASGRFRLNGHQFPVDGPHGTRGYIGEFGAPRVDGRTHEGFDITGRLRDATGRGPRRNHPQEGLRPRALRQLRGAEGGRERRTYKYSHLLRPAPVRQGQQVRAGRRLGSIGQTGNAAGTPCHLHFEVRSRGRLLDPEPLINSWM